MWLLCRNETLIYNMSLFGRRRRLCRRRRQRIDDSIYPERERENKNNGRQEKSSDSGSLFFSTFATGLSSVRLHSSRLRTTTRGLSHVHVHNITINLSLVIAIRGRYRLRSSYTLSSILDICVSQNPPFAS